MRGIHTLASTLLVILNDIECSTRSHRNPERQRNSGPSSPANNLFLLAECCSQIDQTPNSTSGPGTSCPPPSSSGRQNPPDRTHSEEGAVHYSLRSPGSTPPPVKLLGYSLEQLGYIRLVPRMNETSQFEFRRYVFVEGLSVRMKADDKKLNPVQAGEHIVLSTSDGDIFAILEYSGILRSIYSTNKIHSRIKMNMISGDSKKMTPEEMRSCPTGKKYPIFPNNFIKFSANEDSLRLLWNPQIESEEPISFPGQPPSQRVLGYSLAELGYIRLIPEANQNRRFEFRRYVIAANKSIRFQFRGKILPVPSQEYIVVSTSNGEVFAILEYTGILRGIYRAIKYNPRVKINMMSGAVDDMTENEVKECHVGRYYKISPRWFKEYVSNEDSLQAVYH